MFAVPWIVTSLPFLFWSLRGGFVIMSINAVIHGMTDGLKADKKKINLGSKG